MDSHCPCKIEKKERKKEKNVETNKKDDVYIRSKNNEMCMKEIIK